MFSNDNRNINKKEFKHSVMRHLSSPYVYDVDRDLAMEEFRHSVEMQLNLQWNMMNLVSQQVSDLQRTMGRLPYTYETQPNEQQRTTDDDSQCLPDLDINRKESRRNVKTQCDQQTMTESALKKDVAYFRYDVDKRPHKQQVTQSVMEEFKRDVVNQLNQRLQTMSTDILQGVKRLLDRPTGPLKKQPVGRLAPGGEHKPPREPYVSMGSPYRTLLPRPHYGGQYAFARKKK